MVVAPLFDFSVAVDVIEAVEVKGFDLLTTGDVIALCRFFFFFFSDPAESLEVVGLVLVPEALGAVEEPPFSASLVLVEVVGA